jgi:hypothetical protein
MGCIDLPNQTQGTSLEGAGQERLGLVLINGLNNCLINLILWLLVFLMNHLPTAKNGGQNNIDRQWWAPKQYK